MNIKRSFAGLAIFAAFNATAYEHYSVFEDYIDQVWSLQTNLA